MTPDAASLLTIRLGEPADLHGITKLCLQLWPETPASELAAHTRAILIGEPISTLPAAVFVGARGDVVVGFIEVGLRSHADGCDTEHPVGYIEGWTVDPAHHRTGIGRALVAAAEQWARDHGAREMASDTWLDNEVSQRAHEALGYEDVDRCIHYRKSLT